MSVPRFWVEEGFAGLTGLGGLEDAFIAVVGRTVITGIMACDVAMVNIDCDVVATAIDCGGVASPLESSDSGEASPGTVLLLSTVDSFCKSEFCNAVSNL